MGQRVGKEIVHDALNLDRVEVHHHRSCIHLDGMLAAGMSGHHPLDELPDVGPDAVDGVECRCAPGEECADVGLDPLERGPNLLDQRGDPVVVTSALRGRGGVSQLDRRMNVMAEFVRATCATAEA